MRTRTDSSRFASQFLTERQAAQYILMSVFYLRQARVDGQGPAYLRHGRAIRYRLSDLESWLHKRRVVNGRR